MMRPVYLAMTKVGAETARRAAAAVPGDILVRSGLGEPGPTFDRLAEAVKSAFAAGQPVVGFCAAGILVRSVSAILTDKSDDPPVLAVSEDGASIVPLIGGHHGGNRLATAIAAALGGHAAITTAGDLRFGVALDDPPSGWVLANPADAKPVMAALLGGEQARLVGEAAWLSESNIPFATDGTARLSATVKTIDGGPDHLVYHPRSLALGVGCERRTDPAELADLAFETLTNAGLARQAVACVVSIDVKADEAAVIDLAERLDVPARFFTPEILEGQTPRLANPSDMVFAEVGCHGVCEAAALAASGPTGRLVVEKRKSARATCAVAQATGIIEPETIGRARGKLSVVGLGPGQTSWRTPEAGKLITESTIIIGYNYYLDQIADLTGGKEVFGFPLGAEEERVRKALGLAGEGHNVALVSSGDAGIYAMASLVFECLDRGPVSDSAKRIEIIVSPGISALQAAAARIGAPIGHDFCTISLSDLLTPWPVIEKRIQAAAKGDFVIAFYNPVSKRRRTQLRHAREILLAYRPPDTPVTIARMLGRPGEAISVVDLVDLDPETIDMMTLVLVGSSQSRRVQVAGREFVYTPRGYDRKGHTQ